MKDGLKIYRSGQDEYVPKLGKFKDFYFPVGVGNNPFVQNNTSMIPEMATDAKHLNKYFAPTVLPLPRVDHAYWKQAMYDMNNPILPYRDTAQIIFNGTVQNGHVFAALRARADMVLLKDFHLCDEKGVTNEAATKLINKKWFRNALRYIREAEDYGYSLITFGDIVNGDFPALDTVRRAWISPDRLDLSFVPRIPAGINFMDKTAKDKNGQSFYDWSLYVSTPSENGQSKCGYGLLYKVALYEIILRNLIGWNMDFVEMYGQPMRWMKTNEDDSDEANEQEEALKMMASAGYIITDKETEIEIKWPEGGSGTGWQSYNNFEERCVKHISKIVLGHSDALDSTPGKLGGGQGSSKNKGNGSPAEKALDRTEAASSRFVSEVVNDDYIPKLQKLGIPIPVGVRFEFKDDMEKQQVKKSENEYFNETAEWVLALSQAGKSVDSQWLSNRLGIPIIDTPDMQPPDPAFSGELKDKLNRMYGRHKTK